MDFNVRKEMINDVGIGKDGKVGGEGRVESTSKSQK